MPGHTARIAAVAERFTDVCATRITPRVAIRTAAVLVWAVEAWTCIWYRHPSPLHELCGVSTVVISVWMLAEKFGGQRLRPGEIIVTLDSLIESERGAREAWQSVRDPQQEAPERTLKSVESV